MSTVMVVFISVVFCTIFSFFVYNLYAKEKKARRMAERELEHLRIHYKLPVVGPATKQFAMRMAIFDYVLYEIQNDYQAVFVKRTSIDG